MIQRAIDGRPGEWLFDAADRTRARAALSSLAGRLGTGSGVGPSLGTGAAGVAVSLASAALVLDDDGLAVAARGALDRAVRSVRPDRPCPSIGLLGGLAGIGWASAYCSRLLGLSDGGNVRLGGLLEEALAGDGWGGWGLADGLAGVALYASGCGHAPLLRLAIDGLGSCRDDRGHWSSDPVVVFGWSRPEHGGRFADVSVTHGLGGLVGALALAARGGDSTAGALVAVAAGQLIAAVEAEPERDPLAWCCGGLGTAAGLAAALPLLAHHGARALLAGLLGEAVATGVGARRSVGLCHGTAGAFVALHRLARATGDGAATAAARRWGRQLLDEVEAGRTGDGDGLLDGRAGVALALASATGEESGWERALMLP